MSDFSLEGFEAANKVRVGVKEKKAGSGSSVAYDLKYRDGSFSPSAAKWKELDLDNKSMKILVNRATNQVALQVVENDLGTIYKRTAKTGEKKFHKAKAPSIENALEAAGILTKTEKVKGQDSANQYFSLVDKGNGVYLIAEGTKAPVTTPAESTPNVVSDPTPTPEQPAQEAQASAPTEEAPTLDQVASSDDLLGYTEATQPTEAPSTDVEDEDFDEKF